MSSGAIESSSKGSESSSQSQPSRARLVQRMLDHATDLPMFVQDLLTTQAVVVAGTEAVGFLVERKMLSEEEAAAIEAQAVTPEPPDQGVPQIADVAPAPPPSAETPKQTMEITLRPIAHLRPDESTDDVRTAAMKAFQEIVGPCVAQGKDGAIEVGGRDGGEPQFCLVTLLRGEGRIVAVSAVITRCRDLERARQRLGSMQLVAGYFEMFTLRRATDEARTMTQRHQHVLQFSAAVATGEGFEASAMNLCNELATRSGASRVAMGWKKGRSIRVKALSHTEKFDKKQDLIVQIERVMEECFDQEEPVRYDPMGASTANVTRCAKALSDSQGGEYVLALPLRRRDQIVGVLTLEFALEKKPDEVAEGTLATTAELFAPQLSDRYENDRFLIVKAGHSLRDFGKLVLGPKHTLAKLIVTLVIAAGFFVALFKPMYRVGASFQLVAQEPRTLCAPFDGFIKERDENARRGRIVKEGQVLVKFDTSQFEDERDRAQAQAESHAADVRNYGADPTKQAERAKAEQDQKVAEAELRLKNRQIDLATIRAPFDGVIIEGDLHDQLNTTRNQGAVLLKVARIDPEHPDQIAVEAELAVSDRDIEQVRAAHERRKNDPAARDGVMATTSFPSDELGFRITRIVPAGDKDDQQGDNVFKVYATVIRPDVPPEKQTPLAPGLAGEARVYIENRSLWWIWTHRLTDYLRLKLWMDLKTAE